MDTIILMFKIRYYARLINKYSQKSNKAALGLDRNLYFQKYCYYQAKLRILQEQVSAGRSI